ncbi:MULTISPECIES: MBL fold metallo-hydrolase [unclassified Paracoccus (in: a-proteobacteria)]|uniref:MBL fold metallo-hydrolase n=1 Tax=unclassified Paracoccus (in: a-proteobacteria) TaxID=2688777 RepID=UPI0012B36A03|nr:MULTISPECIES: MBL fold metallo-hydrolase [unclassified Paracoccus (in: a-proteobacteria)]UXU73641.1 MBL fold metallo-hydrolase [Paracoccus sp. SMMA_5]UXU79530.1 MBL fold metallo-hydrolase [Paracoccus sp. SMMA_5_TC]
MIRATILGCGSSGGVPRLGNRWGECNPDNPRNRRRRCALLVERHGHDGVTRLLIDTGPDLVPQLLDAGVGELDAVVYTHAHADHIHGIDDLRQIAFNMHRMMPVWADAATAEALQTRFGYIFQTPPGSSYPPVCRLQPICGPFGIDGPGGTIELAPFEVDHGDIDALGFRIGGLEESLVYLPDVLSIPEEAWPTIMGCDVFICDALRRTPHPSHAHLALAVEWIARSGCRQGIITNMHIDLDYDAVMRETPDNVIPAHDGLQIELI